MKMRRLCSCIMALLLAASMPLTAFAVDADISLGDVNIGDTQVSHTTSEGATKTEDHGGSVTVIQSNSSTSTNHNVTINTSTGSSVNVTLSGVNIDTSTSTSDTGETKAAITIEGEGNVNIELDGKNIVQSGNNHAGVEKNNSGNLTITDKNGDGSLTATGDEGGAGIGGGAYSDGSNITISGGTVKANGGENAAGIGGGENAAGSNITISGGNVEANGGNVENLANTDGLVPGGGAGIGGGYRGSGSNITISGGKVTANGGKATTGNEIISGGAGIGGGAYGSGDNIAIKGNAQVTAEGKGNAANIGNGNSEKDTEKQKDKVDLSGLSSFGKVNGVSGSNGSNLGEGSSSGSTGGSGTPKTVASYKTWTSAAEDLGGLKVSDNDGNDLSNVVWLKADSELEITAKEEKVLVSGNKADLLQLTVEGVKQINLETNRVNVSVSNEVLNKITGTGGSFQLSTDDTSVNLTATDQNNKKTLDMTLTANKQSGTQAAPSQSSKKPEISIDAQSNTGNNSEGGTLQVSTNASEATLSLDQKYLQTLMNSEFSKLALDVGNLITTVDSMLAANTAQNGSGSISIGDGTVNMNGFKFSAGDSSENDKLADMVTNIKFKKEITPVGGSAMVVEVDAKAPMKSASLKVPGSSLQSLMDQGVEETALSINGKTTSIKNSDLRTQLGDSQPGSTAVINVKRSANDEITIFAD